MKNIPHGTKLLILERFVEGKDIRRHMHEKIYMCTHTPGPKPLRLKAKWQMTDQQTIQVKYVQNEGQKKVSSATWKSNQV